MQLWTRKGVKKKAVAKQYMGYAHEAAGDDAYASMLEGPTMSLDLLRLLTRAMRHNLSLTELNLSDNDLSSEGK